MCDCLRNNSDDNALEEVLIFDTGVSQWSVTHQRMPRRAANYFEYLARLVWTQKCFSRAQRIYVMDTRIAQRTIGIIQVISCVATVLVTGLILTMVGTSIYDILFTVR